MPVTTAKPAPPWLEKAIALYHEGNSYTQVSDAVGIPRSTVASQLAKNGCKGLRKRQSGLLKVLDEAIKHPRLKRHKAELRAWIDANHEALRQLDLTGDRPLLTNHREKVLTAYEVGRGDDARSLYGEELWTEHLQELQECPTIANHSYERVKRDREDRARRQA